MDKLLANNAGVLRESVTGAQVRAALVDAVPEIAAALEDDEIHLVVSAVGEVIVDRLKSGDIDTPLRLAEVFHQFIAGSRPAGDLANALEISFPPSPSSLRSNPEVSF